MRRCPQCREPIPPGKDICPTCSYEMLDGSRKTTQALSKSIVIAAAVVVGLAVVLAVVFAATRRPVPSEGARAGAAWSRRASDSVPAGSQVKEERAPRPNPVASRAAKASSELKRKVEDQVVRITRERQRLTDARRLTPKQAEILAQAQSRLNGLYGPISSLANAPDEASLAAARKSIEDQLAEIRKLVASAAPGKSQ